MDCDAERVPEQEEQEPGDEERGGGDQSQAVAHGGDQSRVCGSMNWPPSPPPRREFAAPPV